jgi:mono/diheme cytochrome c family protein
LPAVCAAISFLRMRTRLIHRSFAAATLLVAASAAQAQTTAVVGDSAALRQVEVGGQWFQSACIQCHAVGAMANADFRLKWSGRNAYDLYETIRSQMPQSKPGSLTNGTYAAIVAYLLSVNGMPVGSRRLSSDSLALASIRLSFPAASAASRR